MHRALRAGSWTVELGARGDLCSLRLGEEEVLRGLAGVVRDADWGTVRGDVSIEGLVADESSFSLTVRSRHQREDFDFSWTGVLTGTPDSIVRYTFDGVALRPLRSNRIGLVALHSPNWSARPVRITHTDGRIEDSVYPDLVSPHQPFFSIASMQQTGAAGTIIEMEFAGDEFETEDQRNWSDASYKTYSRPLALPFPFEFAAGDEVHQSITLRAHGALPAPARSETSPVTVTVGDGSAPWPRIGVGLAGGVRGTAADASLQRIRPAWVRTDVHLDSDGVLHDSDLVARASALGIPVELALTVADPPPPDSSELAELIGRTEIAHVLIYTEGAPSTSAGSVECVRAALPADSGKAPLLIAGTDGNLAELNRFPPDVDKIDGLTFSLNPQVHDSSERAVMQTIEAYPAMIDTVRATRLGRRSVSGGDERLSVTVSPVTLKPRRNLYATQPESPTAPDTPSPASIDTRQSRSFTAAWTAVALGSLATCQVDRVTFFEEAGPRGIASDEGDPYEVYGVLKVAMDARHAVPHSSSDPSVVDGFVVRTVDDRTVAVLANTTAVPQSIRLSGFAASTVHRTIEPYSVIIIDHGEL